MIELNIKNKFLNIFCIFMYCLLMPGCNDINKPDIIIKDAHLYLPLKGAEMAAGYLRLENNQTKKIVISSIECRKIEASLHETIVDLEGVMKMKKLEMFVVDPGSHVNFMPGGKHVMFSGLREFEESVLRCAFSSNTGVEFPFSFEVLTNER